ncbi:MAG: YiiX/YebB-like N1pC/P60 family cysteine hydrolase [bacterium]
MSIIQTGDLIFEKGEGPISSTIKKFTQSEYSHVAMVYDFPYIVHSHLIGGVQWDDISAVKNQFDVYRLKNGLTNNKKDQLKKAMLGYLGHKYDLSQIFGYLQMAIIKGDNKFNNPDEIICNELVERCYNKIGYTLLKGVALGDSTPGSLAKSKHLVRII